MQDVFIAHDRADIGIAEAYARTLKKLGYEASWDAGGVVNDDWADRALATVKTARCVIALWSPRSVNSEYVNFWATSAAALGKLISVNAYGDAEPRVLHRFGTINLAGWDYATATPAAEQFLAALKKLTKKAPKRDRWMRNAPAPAAPAKAAPVKAAPALATASLPAPEEILAELPPLPADAVVSLAPPRASATEPDLPASLKKPRTKPQREPVRRDWLMWAGGAVAAPVIAVGFFFLGSELRQMLDQQYTPAARADTARPTLTSAAVGPAAASATPTATRANGPRRFAGEENLITLAELERYDWQAIALRLDQRLGEAGATILQEKAATGDPAAKLELCVAHLQGIAGLPREGAHAPCSASAEQAHPAGQFLAWMLRDRANIEYNDARAYLIAAADQGWAPAQRLLASFHRNRQESFTPDAARERALLSSAAAEGYPRAMFDYASLYLRRGSAEDRTLAQQYLQRVMDDREFGLCAQARRVLVQMGDEPPACRR